MTTLAHDGDGRHDIFHLCVVRAPRRDELVKHLQQKGIQCVVHYPKPLHHQPAYAGAHAASITGGPPPLPVSEMLCGRIMSLPMHPYLADAEVARVISAVRGAV